MLDTANEGMTVKSINIGKNMCADIAVLFDSAKIIKVLGLLYTTFILYGIYRNILSILD